MSDTEYQPIRYMHGTIMNPLPPSGSSDAANLQAAKDARIAELEAALSDAQAMLTLTDSFPQQMDALRKEHAIALDRVQAALKPFAACGMALEDSDPEREIFACCARRSRGGPRRWASVTVGDLLRARAALEAKP